MSSERKISHHVLSVGTLLCFLAAIWCPQDALKWVASGVYLQLCGRYFGLTYRNQKIVGHKLHRPKNHFTNFLPLRRKK